MYAALPGKVTAISRVGMVTTGIDAELKTGQLTECMGSCPNVQHLNTNPNFGFMFSHRAFFCRDDFLKAVIELSSPLFSVESRGQCQAPSGDTNTST